MLHEFCKEIENEYFKVKLNLKKLFPIRFIILYFTDKILDKRQFNAVYIKKNGSK